ncbi:hypothetical protein FOZ62_027358 [Perkinsus olseni]|uniref:Myosin motor domain-containing protein n=1 Tax=Perkinsus olseni TaxID=32597 RepID=A0A7J6TVH7_PEROL|nr:hypothetical protein FOZ62_027358 [Perkinsus olseni]
MGYNDGSNDMERLYNHIGILDIYGFESLEKNSYEQLLINLTNERLQQFFVSKVLDREQQAYEAEGIQWESVPLPDATPTVKVIHGALSILDDCCLRASRGMPEDDDKYVGEVQQRFFDGSAGCKLKPPRPQKAPPNRGFRKGAKIERAKITSGFIINHYAGEVTYTASGWMEKNNGRMVPEMESLILGSSNAWAKELGDQEGCSMQCEKFKSVRKHFTDELEKMLKMLDKTGLHYIRCFNPNNQQSPDHFDRRYVLSQVIQCGTVELVNMMHHGYPNRLPIKDLVTRYKHMMPRRFHSMDE